MARAAFIQKGTFIPNKNLKQRECGVMKKLKKQVLGIMCLAAVAIMTMIAYLVPSPKVIAADETTSITETITVRVVDKYAEIDIKTADDGEVFTDKAINIEYDYGATKEIVFELRNEDGELVGSWTKTPASDEEYGHAAFEIDFPSYGDYVLSWRAEGSVPAFSCEDSISISYYPVKVTFVEYDEDGQPIFDIEYTNESALKDLQVYDSNGNNIFNPSIKIPSTDSNYKQIGEEEQVSIYSKKIRVKVILPDSLQTGEYKVGVAGNTAEGELLYKYKYGTSTHVIDFSYTAPDNPDVPNTGSFFSGVNIAKSDSLITGLLIFFSAAIIALFILNKKRTR